MPPTFAGATHRGFDRVPGTSFGHVGQVASMAAALDSFRFIRQVDTEAVSSERIPSVGGSEEPFTRQWAVWEGNHAMALLPAVEALAQEQCRKCWVLTHSQTASAVNLWKSRLVYGLGEKTEAFHTAVRWFLEARQVELVVISSVWNHDASEQPKKFELGLDLTVSTLVQSGTRVILVHDVARQNVDVPLPFHSMSNWAGREILWGEPCGTIAMRTVGAKKCLKG